MGRKSKKVLALLLTTGLLVTSLAGCTNSPASTTSSAPATDSSATDASIPAEPETQTNADREKVNITFSMFGNNTDDPEGMENDPIKKQIEETVNVELKYESGTDGYDDQIATRMATGDAPDLFPTWGQTELITSYIKDEAVTEIGSIITAEPERYPMLNKIINDENYKAYNKLYSGDENKVYALYALTAFFEPPFSGVPVYSTKILNEVNGGKVPETVDEFIEFTKKCGAAGYNGWWPRNDSLSNLGQIDATLAFPQGTSIQAPKGDAWSGFRMTGDDVWKLMTTSEESKNVVKQLNELYKTKGLHNGVGTLDDFTDAKSQFCLNQIGAADYGFGYPAQFKDFYVADWAKANPDTATPEDITMGVSLKNANGEYGSTYGTFMWVGAHWFIPANCKNPDRVLDLIEFLASQAGQDLIFNTSDGEFRADQTAEYWNPINKAYGYGDDGRCKYVWFTYLFSGMESYTDLTKLNWYEAVTNPVDLSEKWASEEDRALLATARAKIDTFVDKAVTKLPVYYTQVVLSEEANTIRAKLQEITMNYLPEMIRGTKDIDKEWANYQAEYAEAGATELETMFNEAVQTAKTSMS